MRILLSGATGFIGSPLWRLLLERGHEVLGLSRRPPVDQPESKTFHHLSYAMGEAFPEGLVRFDPEVLVHLAWNGIPDFSAKTCADNVQAQIQFLIETEKLPGLKKILVAGSCREYGNQLGLCQETDRVSPDSYFCWAKQTLFHYFSLGCQQRNLDLLWFRVFYVYGPGQRAAALIPTLIEAVRAGRKPDIKNPAAANDFIFIDDVLDAFVRGIEQPESSGIVNLGSGQITSVLEVAHTVENLIQRGVSPPVPTLEEDPLKSAMVADIRRARSVLGWEPKIGLSQGIEAVCRKPGQAALSQAVVLCGGLGSRLRPLTDNLPKPMVPVNGKPFLFHLLKQLSEQGIGRFLLLTGYLGEKIVEYFGDGSAWGWSIDYSHGPAEWDTGRRLWGARALFDSQFLLLYSDNFVQFSLPRLKALHRRQSVPITLLLAPKEKGNIRVSSEGIIEAYDKTRSGENFHYVEIGYMLVERDRVLDEFPSCENFPDFNFAVLLQKFALQSKIAGQIVLDPYHSISDPDRLQLMCQYLKPKKVLLIDRDGTMNRKAPPGEYIPHWDRFEWIPETRQAMKDLAKVGFKFIVITNQAGIARKMIDPDDLEEMHQNMILELAEDGVEVLEVYVSPHHWGENSFLRKPSPGMFFQAAKKFGLRMDRCMYIGDDERDCQAASNAGCGMVFVSSEPWRPLSGELPKPYLFTPSLLDSVPAIRDIYAHWDATA